MILSFTTEVGNSFPILILSVRKLRPREVKQLVCGYTASKCQNQDLALEAACNHCLCLKTLGHFVQCPPPAPPTMYQFSSVAQSCPTLCGPMNRSTPGLPVHHHLPEFTQTHVHGVRDAIQPSHPRSSPSPPAPNPSQHQSLFQ